MRVMFIIIILCTVHCHGIRAFNSLTNRLNELCFHSSRRIKTFERYMISKKEYRRKTGLCREKKWLLFFSF